MAFVRGSTSYAQLLFVTFNISNSIGLRFRGWTLKRPAHRQALLVMPNFRTTRMTTNIWIEKGWGDSVENATFDDIKSAIEETIGMDEEHGAFWVGHMENEFVLEVHKNLDLFFVYGENQDEQIQTKLDNWEDVKHFFKLYFDNEFEKLKTEIELRPFTYKKLTNG